MDNKLTYTLFGSRAILIEWEAKIDDRILKAITQFKEQILYHKKDEIEDAIIGYNSLTLLYFTEITDFEIKKEFLQSIYIGSNSTQEKATTLWKIPVCYDIAFGTDLKALSKTLKCTEKDIIQWHSQNIYTVYFIGFLPGFLYLGGLDNRLTVKRKSSPRLSVAKGSVAIGGSQTGIYPMDSAGGWHIIGRTPISFFDIEKETPCFAKAGDRIQFIPITIVEFKKLELEISIGMHQPINRSQND